MPGRHVLHLDMDAFFAAIEQLDNPELRGKPVLVGSDRPRGVVATASYEARPFGCGSAQPMVVARRLCPHAIVVPPRGKRYREVSLQLFDLLHELSPEVEPLSIDEAFVELTGTERLLGPPEETARAIKRRVRLELGLPSSVGLAPNKFLAKLASELEKPDGLTIIDPAQVLSTLAPLPVERLWGVGPATAKRLHRMGVRTVGELQRSTPEALEARLGNAARRLHRLAHGIDDRPIVTDHQAKSIGQEHTYEADVDDPDSVRRHLLGQCDQVARRLRRHRLEARTVTVKIRYGDFETITRSRTLDRPTDLSREISDTAFELFDRWALRGFRPVRLIGVSSSQLGRTVTQPSLFEEKSRLRNRRLDEAVDAIRDRFGGGAIGRGARADWGRAPHDRLTSREAEEDSATRRRE